MTTTIHFDDASIVASVRELSGSESLGEPTQLDVRLTTERAIDTQAVLGAGCVIESSSSFGARRFAGVVTRITTIAEARVGVGFGYRVRVESRFAVLRLRTRSRVYRDKKGFEIVAQILGEGGYTGASVRLEIGAAHAVRTYTVQYAETDADFVRRICEEDGLYFYFDVDGEREVIALADDSPRAALARPTPLPIIDVGLGEDPGAALTSRTEASAFAFTMRRRRRPGRVTLRDYDPAVPAAPLEGVAEAGNDLEKKLAYYEAPGQFSTESDGERRARLRIESLRADAVTARFETTALDLAPGRAVKLEPRSGVGGAVVAEEWLVIAVRHEPGRGGSSRPTLEVEAIPLATPYRLPMVTPPLRLPGLDTAVVTGAPGEEVHPDELGRVFVRFHWDTGGERDDRSSLPVRVTQPHTKGPQLLPRVGWEVLCAFEDGDPDRPVVVGRSFNGKMKPPFDLPANKTVTSIATDSSPGGAKRSSFHFDDAAGRQHMKFQAPFLRDTAVAGEMKLQVKENERYSVTGNQSFKTLGWEKLSVGQGFFETLGSQTLIVGGAHTHSTTGNQDIAVGREVVVVVGAQIEKVGDMVKGAVQLGASAVIEGVSSRGIAGAVVGAGLGLAKAAYDGYTSPTGGGWDSAAQAVKMGAIGIAAGLVPGGDAVVSGVTGTANPNPWDTGHAVSGSAAPGGGAGGGASDSAAAAGPGPGYRQILSTGVGVEIVAGPMALVTPGKIACTTLGGAVVVTGTSRTVRAASVAQRIGGASLEVLGSLDIDAAQIARRSRGAGMMNATGALDVDAIGVNVEAPKIDIKVGGTMTLGGSICMFFVPGASVTTFDGCVFLRAANIEITGDCEQSGAMTHK